jgi:hypothetical protein
MENEVEAYDGSETWVEKLLQDPQHRAEIVAEVRAVADELAETDTGEPLAPDDAVRERFLELARRELNDS